MSIGSQESPLRAHAHTPPSDCLYAAWDFSEARWGKIREIKDNLRAEASETPELHMNTRCEPRCKGIGKIQKALSVFKENGWVCMNSATSSRGDSLDMHLVRRRSGTPTRPVLLLVAPELLLPRLGLRG